MCDGSGAVSASWDDVPAALFAGCLGWQFAGIDLRGHVLLLMFCRFEADDILVVPHYLIKCSK